MPTPPADAERYQSDVAAALAAAAPPVDVQRLATPTGDVVAVTFGADQTSVVYHDERYKEHPSRVRGTIVTTSPDGLDTLVGRYRSDACVVYVDEDALVAEVIFNDDTDGSEVAGWRDHRATFRPVATDAWKHWTEHQGLGELRRFAETVDVGEDQIVDPSPSVMLDIAENFRAEGALKFARGNRLRDGRVEFAYTEEIEAAAGRDGKVAIPPTFTLSIIPFYGADPVTVVAKLRYELRSGTLQIGYVLKDVAEIRRTAFAELVAAIATSNDVTLVHGKAPAVVTPLGGPLLDRD